MSVPDYPGWSLARRLLVGGYPLLLLEQGERRLVISEGPYRQIIELLLNAAKPHEPWVSAHGATRIESIDHILHQGFVSETGWAISGVFFGELVRPAAFADWRDDAAFVAELARLRRRTGAEPGEPIWNASVASGSWRHAACSIPQRSIERLIELETILLSGRADLPEDAADALPAPDPPFELLVDGRSVWASADEQGELRLSAHADPAVAFVLAQAQGDASFHALWACAQGVRPYTAEGGALVPLAPDGPGDSLQPRERAWAYHAEPDGTPHPLAHATLMALLRVTRELLLSQYVLLLAGVAVRVHEME